MDIKEPSISQTLVYKKDRNITFDIAKGILIILMVVGHSGSPEWLINLIYSFHMPCFFIISGLLFSFSHLENSKKYIKRKFKSIWWPFVKWTILFLLLHNSLYNLGIYEEAYSTGRLLFRMFTSVLMLDTEQLLGGFWFLRSLFIASIFCFLYYKLIGYNKRCLIMGILLLLLSAEFLAIINFKYHYLNRGNLLACAYFMCGSLIKSISIKDVKKRKIIKYVFIVLIATTVVHGKLEIEHLNKIVLLPYFIQSVIISYGFIIILEDFKYKKLSLYLSYIGRKTLDILILHFSAFKLISLIRIFMEKEEYEKIKDFPVIIENNPYSWIIYSIIGISLCLFYSYIKDNYKSIYRKSLFIKET